MPPEESRVLREKSAFLPEMSAERRARRGIVPGRVKENARRSVPSAPARTFTVCMTISFSGSGTVHSVSSCKAENARIVYSIPSFRM